MKSGARDEPFLDRAETEQNFPNRTETEQNFPNRTGSVRAMRTLCVLMRTYAYCPKWSLLGATFAIKPMLLQWCCLCGGVSKAGLCVRYAYYMRTYAYYEFGSERTISGPDRSRTKYFGAGPSHFWIGPEPNQIFWGQILPLGDWTVLSFSPARNGQILPPG